MKIVLKFRDGNVATMHDVENVPFFSGEADIITALKGIRKNNSPITATNVPTGQTLTEALV